MSTLPDVQTLLAELARRGVSLPPGRVTTDGYGDSAELSARGAAQNDISTVANISASASTPTQLTDMEFKA